MRFRGSGRPDRDSSERLLDASRRPVADTSDPLTRLLAAAAAPPHPDELAGEEAAMAAFRAAVSDHSARPSRHGHRFRTGAAAWIAGIAVAATAGVAVAASINRPASPPSSSGVAPSTAVPRSAPATGALEGSGRDPGSSPGIGPGAQGGKAADLVEHGLCTAYLSKGPAERGKSLETAAYQRLVDEAGGRHQVEEYCRRLLTEASTAPGRQTVRSGQESTSPHPGTDRTISPSKPGS